MSRGFSCYPVDFRVVINSGAGAQLWGNGSRCSPFPTGGILAKTEEPVCGPQTGSLQSVSTECLLSQALTNGKGPWALGSLVPIPLVCSHSSPLPSPDPSGYARLLPSRVSMGCSRFPSPPHSARLFQRCPAPHPR